MFVDYQKLKKNIALTAAAFFAFAAIGTIIYYILCPSAAFFHSDCSDTIYWAQASVESKSLFNDDFGYAAILPFGGAMIMMPFIPLTGVSLTTHQIGMVIFTAIMFAGIYYLCRCMKFSTALSFTATGLTALILASSEKMREIFYEHCIYYSIGVVILCILLAFYLRFTENLGTYSHLKRIGFCLLIYAFSFMSALDGTQVVACAVLPVIFAAGCEILFSKENIISKKNIPAIIFCGLVLFSTLVGLAALKAETEHLGVGYANAYSNYSDRTEWLNNLLKLPVQWIELFGVDAAYGMSLFSPESIVNILRIATALILGIAPVAALIFINKFDRASKLLIFAHFGMTGIIMFGYVFGMLSAANWRLSPMIATSVLICVACYRAMKPHVTLNRVGILGLCLLFAMSAFNAKTISEMPQNGREHNRYYNLAKFLEEQNLEYGFSTFWHAHTTTVISDSRVRIINTDINENGVTPCPFQTDKKWFEEPDGVDRFFLLCSVYELPVLMATEDWKYFKEGPIEQLEFDEYVIFVFDNTDFLY